jgi:hypothetical protein
MLSLDRDAWQALGNMPHQAASAADIRAAQTEDNVVEWRRLLNSTNLSDAQQEAQRRLRCAWDHCRDRRSPMLSYCKGSAAFSVGRGASVGDSGADSGGGNSIGREEEPHLHTPTFSTITMHAGIICGCERQTALAASAAPTHRCHQPNTEHFNRHSRTSYFISFLSNFIGILFLCLLSASPACAGIVVCIVCRVHVILYLACRTPYRTSAPAAVANTSRRICRYSRCHLVIALIRAQHSSPPY